MKRTIIGLVIVLSCVFVVVVAVSLLRGRRDIVSRDELISAGPAIQEIDLKYAVGQNENRMSLTDRNDIREFVSMVTTGDDYFPNHPIYRKTIEVKIVLNSNKTMFAELHLISDANVVIITLGNRDGVGGFFPGKSYLCRLTSRDTVLARACLGH